jgi:hypothetical protein
MLSNMLRTAHAALWWRELPPLHPGPSVHLTPHPFSPHSLRTLCRAMEYARAAMPVYGVQRARFAGLSMVRAAAHPPRSASSQPSRGFKMRLETTTMWANSRNLT